jgi:hypothetical protein
MVKNDWIRNLQEPTSAGREAFWEGRPVWANPLTGVAARAWKAGWTQGQTELSTRAGESALTTSADEFRKLLRQHRPADIDIVPARTSEALATRIG